MVDVLVVGAGIAGVCAALGLVGAGVRPVVLDVGYRSEVPDELPYSFYERRGREDVHDWMVGKAGEGLLNHFRPPGEALPAKLVPPGMSFILRGAEELSPVDSEGFVAIQSFAAGGLANAWGAGLYRFDDFDLDGMPVAASELAPWYDSLTERIGITAASDDLTPFFGPVDGHRPPLRPSRNAARLLAAWDHRRERLRARGLHLGRPRLAVASEGPESAWSYGNLEFWQAPLPHVYTPLRTLDELAVQGVIDYRPGLRVESYERHGSGVRVHARRLPGGAHEALEARYLALAAGPLGSARIVLQSRGDTRTRLPLLDNPAIQLPLVLPAAIGQGLETDAFGLTQLNLVYAPAEGARLQASLLETTAPARAEFFPSFPVAARSRLRFLRDLLPATMVMQLFHPIGPEAGARLRLANDGRLGLSAGAPSIDRPGLRAILGGLARLGALGFPALGTVTKLGMSVHYAGTLPAKHEPYGPYQCTAEGLLGGDGRVYVADGSWFECIPAKNSSFTVMANAMRIGDLLGRRIRSN